MCNFRLGKLFVGAQLAPFDAHFLRNQRRENNQRNFAELLIILAELRQAMSVHFRHLYIGDDQRNLLPQLGIVAQFG